MAELLHQPGVRQAAVEAGAVEAVCRLMHLKDSYSRSVTRVDGKVGGLGVWGWKGEAYCITALSHSPCRTASQVGLMLYCITG